MVIAAPRQRGNEGILDWAHRVMSASGVDFPPEYLARIEGAMEARQNLAYHKRTFLLALFGDKGSMKSALMCYGMIRRAATGRPVFYWPPTYDFALGRPLELEELVGMTAAGDKRLRGALLGLDEFQVMQSKWRMSSRVNLELRTMWQQLRKLQVDIMLTSNSPNEIDPTVQDFVDYHLYCTGRQDKRCERLGRHLSRRAGDYDDCRDAVQVEMYDTQARWGFKTTYDGRRRRKHLLAYTTRVADVYPLYNTFASVTQHEIREVTSESVDRRLKAPRSVVDAEMGTHFVRSVIPQLVKAGMKEIAPGVLERALEKVTFSLQSTRKPPALTREYIGRILRLIKLDGRHTNDGMRYLLPPPERLPQWQDATLAALAPRDEE